MQIDALLEDTPHRSPGRVALDDGDRIVTYGDLADVVRLEAAFLAARGGARFALFAENGCAWAIGDLALHHLGRLNVPLPTSFSDAQQRHVLTDAGVDTVLTDRPEEVAQRWPEFRVAGCSPASGLQLLRRSIEPAAPPGVTKITYTSGSTGEPKGVCLTDATISCVSRSLAQIAQTIGVRRHLSLLPLPTLLENLAGIHAPLRAGATCILPPAHDTGIGYSSLDAARMLDVLARTQPQSLVLVPELLRVIVRAAQSGHVLPKSLKFIAVGGAAVSRSLLDEARDVSLPVYEGYGLSECASVVCLNTPQHARSGSVGMPLAHARVRVDERGQIHVRGAVMSGYLGEMPAKAPIEVATGDLGEIDAEGFVYVRGRLRNVFITSLGRNISPEWVERELSHESAIRHAIAYGEARAAVCALVSPARADLDASVVDNAVSRANLRLPDYAKVRSWLRMPEIPTVSNGLLTSNGRLRRERVLERYGALLRTAS